MVDAHVLTPEVLEFGAFERSTPISGQQEIVVTSGQSLGDLFDRIGCDITDAQRLPNGIQPFVNAASIAARVADYGAEHLVYAVSQLPGGKYVLEVIGYAASGIIHSVKEDASRGAEIVLTKDQLDFVKGEYEKLPGGTKLFLEDSLAAGALGALGKIGAAGLKAGKSFVLGAEAGVFEGYAADSVWAQGPVTRGVIIEERFGANLHRNFPVIDKFENGIVTSIKSIDLNAPTYQNPATLRRVIKGYVDKVAGFTQQRFAGRDILEHQVFGRELRLAVPATFNSSQDQIIREIMKYSESKSVVLKVIKIKK